MQRRHFITTAGAVALAGLGALPAWAQVTDLNDAINKAGRQRMLSQRMGKAWLALVHGVEPTAAQQVLDKSMALFDRQLAELKAYAPNAEIRDTYGKLEGAWSDYKAALVGTAPGKPGAAGVLQADARVLALAHQGTVQYEAASGKPVGKLVNVAGRQRMLSQRMAKFYLAAMLPVDAATASGPHCATRAASATTQNTPRQPVSAITPLPASGARIGETLNTSISSDMRRAASAPVCRSRTMARGIAMPAAAPSPCRKRSATRVSMSGARAQPTLPTPNRIRPKYSGGLRPTMSDTGP